MKLKAKIFAVAVCAMALCVALVGCAGGGTNSGSDNAANFQGDWMLSGGQNDGQELDAESIEAMEQMGLYVYMQLNEGGNAVISLFGTNTNGTWEAKDANTVAITFEGDTADATLEGDELVLAVEGNSLKFKKGEIPADALAAAAGTTEDAGQAAE
ncbi:hypothetical protein VIN30_06815 [Adlercreutzia sp. R7]|uniref:Lipocalin-like domain-containing protein n=1 Tax=Adlercreutzia wanghongyangiae TaxID=3111451 RepID=A0ABU6IIC9_9ACTN|nr:hypothetical protein [Adlercreutzia sp. R7]